MMKKIKKTFFYKLLKISLIVLVLLIVLWVLLFILGRNSKSNLFEGELGNSKFGDFLGLKFDELGKIVFYLIVCIILVIILIIVWLFIKEKNKKNQVRIID